jgi:monoamine oxidase
LPRASASSRTAIVVGAGFAGLAAADALLAAGVDVTVVEAADRVGGRVHSHALGDGSVVELGAEFVLPGYELLTATVARLGLGLYEKGTLYGFREPRGGQATTAAAMCDAAASLTSAAGGSIADALDRLVPDAGTREAVASRVAVSTAHELDDQPAEVLADGAAGFGRFASHGVAGGNDRIARELGRPLGARLQLGTPAVAVAWATDRVRVRTRHGELAADACVVAVPAPRALDLAFDPPLPSWKTDALASVRYGQAAKLFLPLEEPPPSPSATLSVPQRFWTWTQNAPSGGVLPVASSFAGSPSALARLGVAEGPAAWVEAVHSLRPDLRFADAAPLLATWPGGAYSARSLSSPADDEALARSVGPLAFAGEHTAGAWYGLMEGALRSGVRAAAAVLTPG